MAAFRALLAGDGDDLLIERIRTGLWLCLTSITLFGLTDPFLHPQQLAPIYGIKALQLALIAFFFWACRQRPGRRWAILLAQTIVFTMSITTAW